MTDRDKKTVNTSIRHASESIQALRKIKSNSLDDIKDAKEAITQFKCATEALVRIILRND